MPIALADLLDEKNVILDLRTRQMPVALRKLIFLLSTNGKIEKPEEFLQQVVAREKVHPSVVENSVAFPHARTDLVNEIVIGIGRSRMGVPFANGDRARLIFVIAVPRQLVNDYLICVGALARLLRDDVTRATLLHAETPTQFLDALRSADETSI